MAEGFHGHLVQIAIPQDSENFSADFSPVVDGRNEIETLTSCTRNAARQLMKYDFRATFTITTEKTAGLAAHEDGERMFLPPSLSVFIMQPGFESKLDALSDERSRAHQGAKQLISGLSQSANRTLKDSGRAK